MLSKLGTLFILVSILISFSLLYCCVSEIKIKNSLISKRISYLSFLQSVFVILSFFILLFAYVFSDFSLINVYENSHTTKPLFYKISGVWGNHEGSLLLWIMILVLFSSLFFNLNKSNEKKFKLLTLIFQNVLILGFLIFLLSNSNPFIKLYPIPQEGMGLNPILQDPALAIHPPLLYLGFVGSSIYFSAALASLISKFDGINFAKSIKYWVLISWFFQTIGILVGSIWAYYELGWGGYWFWDPVENSSLMPWFLMTALIHSILILERKKGIYLWVIILSILTFTMSVTGTFLVRSGILNSVHTFANDPSRGLYILTFLSFMIFSSLYVFYKYAPNEKRDFEFLSKEFFILINNWFMIFFLVVVLIGTLYPIALEVLSGKKISVGPPYYSIVMAPFLIPFLFFASYGPQTQWLSSKSGNIKNNLLVLFISTILVLIFFYFTKMKNVTINLILIFSIYLIVQNIWDFFKSLKKNSLAFFYKDLPRITSHLGFGFLIFFISINSIFSVQHDLNLKVSERKKIDNFEITLKYLNVSFEKNYKKVVGDIVVNNDKKNISELLKPEIRIYNQPETITYEASIKSKLLSDTYVTMSNIAGSDFYNIKFQKKPFMNFIWLSVILIGLGGFIRILVRQNK
tara:strand:+ start:4223 stop:6118 length:1896 start_codon:yes stop_codon:yes gene_type:complete